MAMKDLAKEEAFHRALAAQGKRLSELEQTLARLALRSSVC